VVAVRGNVLHHVKREGELSGRGEGMSGGGDMSEGKRPTLVIPSAPQELRAMAVILHGRKI